MNKPTRFLILSSLAVMAAAFAPAGFDEAATLSARANGAMSKYLAAFKRKDAKTCEAILRANFAKDYKQTDTKGKVRNLDEMIAQEKMHMAMVQKVEKASLKLSNVKVTGNSATAKGAFMMDATIGGDPQKPKETHKLHVDAKWDCKLKKVNGKWWIAAEKATSEKVLVDGKPMGG